MLSFIIPVYNPEPKIFERCLKSIIDQSLTDWQAIFVLDGPNEDVRKTISRIFKKHVDKHSVYEINHSGACAARNYGFEKSVGEYVIFFDCDVIIEPHSAAAWVDIFNSHPEVGFIYSGYKFLDEKGAINSEPFDPWLLRVTNYISTCFPVRRNLVQRWDTDIESLQDWDFWLSVVKAGGKGKFLPGYAFSTAYPTPASISGKGCTPEKWLSRMDKVREKHNIQKKSVCVASISNKMDGIALAKLIDADYLDRPADKPNHYKTIIQVGFSLSQGSAEAHATMWGVDHKKILFWTRDDVDEVYNAVSLSALDQYAERMNKACTMYVEDRAAMKIMERAGFRVSVMPLPMVNRDELSVMPEKPKFLVDASEKYGHVVAVLKRALPDIGIDISIGVEKIENYTGLIHFFTDRTMSSSVKRMLLNGRHVISNIQSPFAGFLDDHVTDENFIVNMVNRIRKIVKLGPNKSGADYYKANLGPERLAATIQ